MVHSPPDFHPDTATVTKEEVHVSDVQLEPPINGKPMKKFVSVPNEGGQNIVKK